LGVVRRRPGGLGPVLGVLLALASLEAGAQRLVDVYRLAREHDPKFKAAEAEFLASEHVHDQSRAGLLPSVRLDMERLTTRQHVYRSNNPIFGAGVTQFPTDNTTFSVTQPVFRKDIVERIAQTRAAVRQANFTMLAAEHDLMQRTASTYLSVLAARDSLDLAKAEKESVRRNLELADVRLKRGLGTAVNLHDATARFAVNQAREIEAENKLADALQALKEITGTQIQTSLRLGDRLRLIAPQPSDPQEWVQKAIEQNYAVRARSEAVEVAAQEVQRQRAAYWPTVNLVGTMNRRDTGSTLFGGGSEVGTQELTLRLSLPIFEGGLTRALTSEAAQRHIKAKEERELERRAAERQARAAYQSVVGGISLVQALQQSVQAQRSALEGKEIAVQRGLLTLLAVLDAERDLFIARRDYAQARYDYLLNSLRLKQAAGTLSEEDLLQVDSALQ
jgi:outer membrane protein